MAGEMLIRLEAVTKNYPMGEVTVHALRQIDLQIAAGEFVVLLGPSGCGKTTTLNWIGGLDKPTSGRVVVQGEDIAHYDENQLTDYRRRKMGIIFQFFNLIPTLSAAENVEFALALSDGHNLRGKALDLLERIGLRDRADHFPSQLSGGEQQRVAIARALANDPRVLLCDEPTGNLDMNTGQQVLSAIRDLNRKEGTTVVFVTHNSAIAPLADRVVRLRDGAVERIE
ncbi:MAG: ABC transporter ATP-binding protein [Chloroflexi bacterium]|nr:ABC transporter ATP-binding protein [Chloroflexota bacterium]